VLLSDALKCWVAIVTNEGLLSDVELVIEGDGGVGWGENQTVIQSLEVAVVVNAEGEATTLRGHWQKSGRVGVVTHGGRLADGGVQLLVFEDSSNIILI